MPVDFAGLQDLYDVMWWIRVELEEAKCLDAQDEAKRWQSRYDSICRVAKVAFRHVPLQEAIENYMLDWANDADWIEDVEELLKHYRETCSDSH
jgi:hypothetical protein